MQVHMCAEEDHNLTASTQTGEKKKITNFISAVINIGGAGSTLLVAVLSGTKLNNAIRFASC